MFRRFLIEFRCHACQLRRSGCEQLSRMVFHRRDPVVDPSNVKCQLVRVKNLSSRSGNFRNWNLIEIEWVADSRDDDDLWRKVGEAFWVPFERKLWSWLHHFASFHGFLHCHDRKELGHSSSLWTWVNLTQFALEFWDGRPSFPEYIKVYVLGWMRGRIPMTRSKSRPHSLLSTCLQRKSPRKFGLNGDL